MGKLNYSEAYKKYHEKSCEYKKLLELTEKEISKCKKACEESIKTQKQTDYYQGLADGYGIILNLLEGSKK